MGFKLARLHFTLAHPKDQAGGHAHFECEYLTNCKREGWLTLILPSNVISRVDNLLAYLELTLVHSKGHGQGHARFNLEYL